MAIARAHVIKGRRPPPPALTCSPLSAAQSLPESSQTLKFGAEAQDLRAAMAAAYFSIIRVLHVLDANEDLTISPGEMAPRRQCDI